MFADSLKSRLFLAGIISSATSGDHIEIKNKVVSASLSEDWLAGIQSKFRGFVKLAREAFIEHRYVDAVAYYESFLREATLEGMSIDLFRLGLAYLHVQRPADAMRYIELYHQNVTAKEREESLFHLARVTHHLGDLPRTIAIYRETIESVYASKFHDMARAYLSAALIQANFDQNKLEAFELATELLSKGMEGSPRLSAARAIAAITLATIQRVESKVEEALMTLEKALTAAPPAYRPVLVLQAAETVKVRDSRYSGFIARLVETFLQYSEKSTAGDQADLTGITDEYWWRALLLVRRGSSQEIFEQMVLHAEKHGLSKRYERHDIYRQIWSAAHKVGLEDVADELSSDIVKKFRGAYPRHTKYGRRRFPIW